MAEVISSSWAHLKWPCGQDLYPCNPQGRQLSPFTSIMVCCMDRGPNPNAGTVLQKNAVTGASMDEQMCKGAESLTKFMAAVFMSAAVWRKLKAPARLTTLAPNDD